MRLYEFADAEAQLVLLRTIIDNTWTAIAQQAEQKKRADAQRKSQAKLKPRTKKSSKGASLRLPTPTAPPPKIAPAPLAKQPPPQAVKSAAVNPSTIKPIPSTGPKLKPLPNVTPVTPKSASSKAAEPVATTPIKASNPSKTAAYGANIGAVKKDDDGDDRHSKNGIATLKKLPRSF
jgi:hypothetical protein